MSAATANSPHLLLTAPGAEVTVPPWMRDWSPRTIPGNRVGTLRRLPDITVVDAPEPSSVLRSERFLSTLAARHAKTPGPSKVLFVFRHRKTPTDVGQLEQLLAFFDRFRDVEFARGADQAAFALQESWAKLLRDQATEEAAARGPFAELAAGLALTADLRSGSGRLSAEKVAGCFGLSVAELARLLGRSRQAVSKTDDAESTQRALAPFERIARLRAALPGVAFSSWLNADNELLDDQTPLARIRAGAAAEVADVADDMLSGAPA
jgi:hypothetical protein